MTQGRSKVFIALGGNFAAAMPDTEVTRAALAKCDLTVNVSTKLNRSHLTPGKDALILPCLGRTEIDSTSQGEQCISVEDSMSMVHSSAGIIKPSSKLLKSEVAIVANIAKYTLSESKLDWLELAADNRKIRNLIEQCISGFSDYNQRLESPGGFYLGNTAAQRQWMTKSGFANIKSHRLPDRLIAEEIRVKRKKSKKHGLIFTLQTMRSHDQYNTTIYGLNDRYRGIKGQRKVIFMHADDMQALELTHEQKVTITSHWHDGSERSVSGFKAVAYGIPKGNMAAYYPETNPLVALDSYGDRSFTPTSKAIAISITKDKISNMIALEARS